MKQLTKFLFAAILGLFSLTSYAQETVPDSLGRLIPVNGQFFVTIHNGDTLIWHQKGAPYGIEQLARHKDVGLTADIISYIASSLAGVPTLTGSNTWGAENDYDNFVKFFGGFAIGSSNSFSENTWGMQNFTVFTTNTGTDAHDVLLDFSGGSSDYKLRFRHNDAHLYYGPLGLTGGHEKQLLMTGDAPTISQTYSIAKGKSDTLSAHSDSLYLNKPAHLIYNAFYWTALTAFTYSGFTPTISSNNINFSGGSNTATQTMIVNGYTNQDENLDIEAAYTINTLGLGLGAGRKSINTVGIAYSALAQYDGTNNLIIIKTIAGGTVTTTASKSSGIVAATGDQMVIKYSQRGYTITATVIDITQGVSSFVSATTNLTTASSTFNIPNAADICLYNIGGSNDINAITVTSYTPYRPDVCFVGDSKFAGVSAGGVPLRASNLCKALGTVVNMSGKADATAQMAAAAAYITNYIKPKVIFINDGRNDIAYATDTATWHAAYRSMVAAWKAAGIRVEHCLPIPELFITDQSSVTTFINANFASADIIDPSPSFNTATDIETAGSQIHPNTHGNKVIAQNIVGSGKIPLALNGSQKTPVSDNYTSVGATSVSITTPSTVLMVGGAAATVPASTTDYIWATGCNGTFSTSEGGRLIIMPAAGVLRNLYVKTSGSQPASGTLTVTVRKNLADQVITLTIPVSAASGVFTDLTHTLNVAAGDVISLEFINTATAVSTGLIAASLSFTPN